MRERAIETTRFPPRARIFDLILSSQRRQRRLFKRPWFICSSSTFSRIIFFFYSFIHLFCFSLFVHYWIRSHVAADRHRPRCETLQLWNLPQFRCLWRTTSIHWTNNRFPFSAQQLRSFARSWVEAGGTALPKEEESKKSSNGKNFLHSNTQSARNLPTVGMSFHIAFDLWVRPSIRIIIYLRPGKQSEKQSNPMSWHLLLSVRISIYQTVFCSCSFLRCLRSEETRFDIVWNRVYQVRLPLTLMTISRSYPFIWKIGLMRLWDQR